MDDSAGQLTPRSRRPDPKSQTDSYRRRGYAGTELVATLSVVALIAACAAMLGDPLALTGNQPLVDVVHPARSSPFESSPLYALAVSENSGRVAVGSMGGRLRVWDAVSMRLLSEMRIGFAHVKSLAFANRGERLFAVDASGNLTVIDGIGSQIAVKAISIADCELLDLTLSRDERRMGIALTDGSIVVRDAVTYELQHVLRKHTDVVRSVSFSPNGSRLVSAADDGFLRVWDTNTGLEVSRCIAHQGESIQSACYSPNGEFIVSGGRDAQVRLWRADSLELVREFDAQGGDVISVAFDPEGTRVAAGSFDHSISVWNLERATDFEVFAGHRNCVRRVAYCPNGGRLFSASWDGTVQLWDLESGESPVQFAFK